MTKNFIKKPLAALMFALTVSAPLFPSMAAAERIGDIAELKDVRNNQLQGFGLVVGLPNSGDRGNFASSNLMTLIQKYGIKVPESINLSSRNVAVVMINANLPPFAKKGQEIDVTVSTIGNAKSLRGGTLLTTPLMGLNGEIFAVGQGQVLTDGISSEGMDGSTLDVNLSSVARIPMGATVERELSYNSVFDDRTFTMNLASSDFATVSAVEKTINKTFGEGVAKAVDAGSLKVVAPRDSSSRIEFIAVLKSLEIEMPDQQAKVIINARTGTVVITQNVTLSPVAISEGNVVINISEDQQVSQPNSFSGGDTVTTTSSQISIERKQGELEVVNGAGTLQDLVSALNAMGTSSKDLANIIQLLKQSGSLKSKVIVI
ncbi:flagellar basal body P-ring protein FlgI [Vibrio coralliirubri]|uniref:flagellar basal body P-ring protein FlgI n=1 Tax=Vibrio coralliirubri TaxID=1516159 RepID=UPI002284C245|nr:flagellar basal body P-ring protein FlgI [Vibrio coralliirubri]MCY9860975.1 flagellar basal body P-ring protein FlgI [Vibrio coralliirubri]